MQLFRCLYTSRNKCNWNRIFVPKMQPWFYQLLYNSKVTFNNKLISSRAKPLLDVLCWTKNIKEHLIRIQINLLYSKMNIFKNITKVNRLLLRWYLVLQLQQIRKHNLIVWECYLTHNFKTILPQKKPPHPNQIILVNNLLWTI